MLRKAISLTDNKQGILSTKPIKDTPGQEYGHQEIKTAERSPDNRDNLLEDEPILIKKHILKKKAAAKEAQLFEAAPEEEIGGIEDGARSKLEFEKLQIIDISVLFSAAMGGFITVLTYDVEFQQEDPTMLWALLWTIFASTIIAIILNIARYIQKLRYHKARKLVSEKENLFTSGQIWSLLFEIILLLIQPYPWSRGVKVDDYYGIQEQPFFYYANDILSVLVVVRIYILGRVLLNHTAYRSPRARRLNAMYGSDNTYLYAVKCLMRNSPFFCVIVTFGVSVFIFGYMLRICERPISRFDNEAMLFTTYWNSMWCVILTMTTVGYGDYYPRTHYGRVVTFMCCIWGVFVVSIVVVTLTNTLTMSNAEEKALVVLQRLELRKTVRSQAVDVLTSMTRIGLNNKSKKGPVAVKQQNEKLVKNIKNTLDSFKQNTRQIRALSDTGNINETMSRHFDFMRDEMKEMRAEQQVLRNAIQRLTEAVEAEEAQSVHQVPASDILGSLRKNELAVPETRNGASSSRAREQERELEQEQDRQETKYTPSLSKVTDRSVPLKRHVIPSGIFA